MNLIVASPEAFAPAALRALDGLLGGIDAPVAGLASGETPIPLYRLMAEHGWHFPAATRLFAIDEYISRAPHPGTNASFFARHLPAPPFPPVGIADATAPDPAAEIARFDTGVRAAGGFDVALLGIGLDGHVAFNEPPSGPGAPSRVVALSPATRSRLAATWDPPPMHGMTLGMDLLLAARALLLLATGSHKAMILAGALEGPCTPNLPASFLQRHPALTVVCDAPAAASLTIPP